MKDSSCANVPSVILLIKPGMYLCGMEKVGMLGMQYVCQLHVCMTMYLGKGVLIC